MISPPNAEKTNTETDAKLHHIIKSRRKKSFAAAAIKVKKEKGKTKKNREKNKLDCIEPNKLSANNEICCFYYKKINMDISLLIKLFCFP